MSCASLKKCCIICISSIKEAILEFFTTLYFVIFFNKNKQTSNAIMKTYDKSGLHWRAPCSELKYCVIVTPSITHDSWSFNTLYIQVMFFSLKQLLQDENNKAMIKRVKIIFKIHSCRDTYNIKSSGDFNYVRN